VTDGDRVARFPTADNPELLAANAAAREAGRETGSSGVSPLEETPADVEADIDTSQATDEPYKPGTWLGVPIQGPSRDPAKQPGEWVGVGQEEKLSMYGRVAFNGHLNGRDPVEDNWLDY